MKPLTKIYIGVAVAAIFAVGILSGSAWSDHKIHRLETAVEAARDAASTSERLAVVSEQKAAEYKQKTEYLEGKLTEIQTIARKQDDELEKLSINSLDAHARVDRTRNRRSVTTNAAELCKKLADTGHGCTK